MIAPPPGMRVYLACGHTDMRKGMSSLAMLVQQTLGHDPFGGAIYTFRGRRGQHATFYIQFAVCEDRLSLAPAVWPYAAGVALPAR
jgi:transposase